MSNQHSIALNYLTASRATLQLVEFPEFSLNTTGYALPELTLNSVDVPSPFFQKALYGSKLIYGAMTVEFLVDEHLVNYKSLHDWIRGLGAPLDKSENAEQVKIVKYTDAILTIYNSHNRPLVAFRLLECTPVYLSGLTFTETTQDTTPVKAQLTLQPLRYEFDIL